MHDKNGTPLEVGDIVILRLRVRSGFAGQTYCNVTLDYGFEAEHGPGNCTGSVSSINTRQVVLLQKAVPVQ